MADTQKPTDEEMSSLCYFIEHKGDEARYVRWPEIREAVAEHYPDLYAAIEGFHAAERQLTRMVREVRDGLDV